MRILPLIASVGLYASGCAKPLTSHQEEGLWYAQNSIHNDKEAVERIVEVSQGRKFFGFNGNHGKNSFSDAYDKTLRELDYAIDNGLVEAIDVSETYGGRNPPGSGFSLRASLFDDVYADCVKEQSDDCSTYLSTLKAAMIHEPVHDIIDDYTHCSTLRAFSLQNDNYNEPTVQEIQGCNDFAFLAGDMTLRAHTLGKVDYELDFVASDFSDSLDQYSEDVCQLDSSEVEDWFRQRLVDLFETHVDYLMNSKSDYSPKATAKAYGADSRYDLVGEEMLRSLSEQLEEAVVGLDSEYPGCSDRFELDGILGVSALDGYLRSD